MITPLKLEIQEDAIAGAHARQARPQKQQQMKMKMKINDYLQNATFQNKLNQSDNINSWNSLRRNRKGGVQLNY